MLKLNRIICADDAVSTVVAVIILIAITVILGVALSAFLLGATGDMHEKKTPAFTITRILDHADIKFVSNGGANTVTDLTLTTAPSGAVFTKQAFPVVGDTYTISNINVDNAYIVMTVKVDGEQQTVLEQTI